MKNLRVYGKKPFNVAVVHGGPGAPGEMAPVARELAAITGVLEPLQTAVSLEGQVQELHEVLKKNADPPVTLIGWSWGAWLSFIFTARHPSLVRKLVLVGSGPYEEKYADNMMPTRLNRMTEAQRAEVFYLAETLNNPFIKDKNAAFARLGEIITRADTYDALPHESEVLEMSYGIYDGVWQQANELRRNGRLLELGRQIRCPVVAIHGDYDPHPAEGVREPLERVLKDFRFVLLEKCGHEPWIERAARDRFYQVLTNELK
jgi:pimeloyl-ACP methyl ester carboxylesterase